MVLICSSCFSFEDLLQHCLSIHWILRQEKENSLLWFANPNKEMSATNLV